MRIFARLVISAAFAAFVSLLAGAAAAQMKVAVVDVQRAVAQTEAGLRAAATLKKASDDSEQQGLNHGNVRTQQANIDQQAPPLFPTQALQKKYDDWQRGMIELDAQKELEKRQKALTNPILEMVMMAIKRIAGTDGFDLILDRSVVAFSHAAPDLTDRVIRLAEDGLIRRSNYGGSSSPARRKDKKTAPSTVPMP
jgi:outer membrane protein